MRLVLVLLSSSRYCGTLDAGIVLCIYNLESDFRVASGKTLDCGIVSVSFPGIMANSPERVKFITGMVRAIYDPTI